MRHCQRVRWLPHAASLLSWPAIALPRPRKRGLPGSMAATPATICRKQAALPKRLPNTGSRRHAEGGVTAAEGAG